MYGLDLCQTLESTLHITDDFLIIAFLSMTHSVKPKMVVRQLFIPAIFMFLGIVMTATGKFDGEIVRMLQNDEHHRILEKSKNSCISLGEHLACYDTLNATESESGHSHNHFDAFMAARSTFEKDKVGFRACDSCEHSVKRKHTLKVSNDITLSILLIRPKSCKSSGNVCGLGNILGFYFEAVSFGLANGYLIGRLDPLADQNCGEEDTTSQVLTFLPRLIIPKTFNSTRLNALHCTTIDRWPWENTHSYFWRNPELLGSINRKMMSDYTKAIIPNAGKTTDSVGIHFRCGDSLYHGNYGVFPFHVYRTIFSELASSHSSSLYIIYTDVNKGGYAYGQLCWNLLGELQIAIKRTAGLKNVNVLVDFSSPAESIAKLHLSKVIVCSVSTFCFFSSMGSSFVYQPGPVNLFRDPNMTEKKLSYAGGKFFEPQLLRPLSFPSLDAGNFTEMVLNSS